MEKDELIKELRKKFDETKKHLRFKATYSEINDLCFIEDMVLSSGYVSNQFSRQLITRMIETFYSWINEIYMWVYPNHMDMIHINENRKLSQEDKKEILAIIDRIMYFLRKNKRIAFAGNSVKEEGEIIDEMMEFNKKQFTPMMFKFNKKFEELWKEEFSKGNSK
jgi:hypothetical protein